MKLSTTIGSLPQKEPSTAVDLILKNTPDLPAWPQLPRRGFFENMIVQYSENFPGIVIDEKERKIFVETDKSLSQMEEFYENFLNGHLDYFSISEKFAAGFHCFFKQLSSIDNNLFSIKCQTVGPVTYAMMLKDEKDRSIFFNEQLKDVAIKHIIMKSLWQIKKLSTLLYSDSQSGRRSCCLVLFLDEPYLSAYGSAFTALSRDEVVNTLKEAISGIKSFNDLKSYVKIGVHCCGNTDWSLLFDSEIDILSFDAYGYFDNLLLYIDELSGFINRGGILAWGIVPTDTESIEKETTQNLKQMMEKYLDTLSARTVDREKLKRQMYITPSCGMGSLSEELSEKALTIIKELSELL